MHKILPTVMLVITAITMLGGSVGMTALAATTTTLSHGGGTNVFNITVNCGNGTQAHKTASSSSSVVANVNVVCTGGGGGGGTVGPKGDKGDPGATGAQGEQGLPGVQGVKGDTGERGATGPAGNATVCIVVGNETCGITSFNETNNPFASHISPPLVAHDLSTSHFTTKNFDCTSVASSPFACAAKQ